MGVIPCNRVDCDNILCSREGYYGGEVFRICNECFEELVKLGTTVNIYAFMEGRYRPVNEEASRAYWNTIFPE